MEIVDLARHGKGVGIPVYGWLLLVARRTSSATAAHTLDSLIGFEVLARHAADAGRTKVGFGGLDATKAA